VAVNDLGKVAKMAYLLKHDTVYRDWTHEKNYSGKEIMIDGKSVKVLAEKDPSKLPWKDLNIDIAIEATGVFESFEKASAHLTAGAKKVIISSPAKDDERVDAKTILLGVNDSEMSVCKMVATGSCTTNATHPVAQVMLETVGVKKAVLNTIHSYTGTQSLVDGISSGKSRDFRRGRAAAMNIIPSTSGVTVSVTRAVKGLAGKFDGMAMRVPSITGSLVDFTFVAGRPTTVDEINNIFRQEAQNSRWQGLLAVAEDQIVSSDVIGTTAAAIIDLSFTKVVDGDLVKVFSWYDNEWGYVATLVKYVTKISETLNF
jgi:glyceraldehyde 3-phosphate dehydrogenase